MLAATLSRILPSPDSDVNAIRTAWDRLHRLPGGDALFHLAIKLWVPYTGSMGARVVALREGHAEVELVERRAIRNHLRSVHAIALANLIELAGNIAVAYALPDDARFIVRGISVQYHKKARGRLVATSDPVVPRTSAKTALQVEVVVRDASGEVVCTGTLDTLIGPKSK